MADPDLIALARQAGFETEYRPGVILAGEYDYTDEMRRFAALVAEECAKAAMTCPVETYCSPPHLAQSKKQREDTAAAIRAMFKEPAK